MLKRCKFSLRLLYEYNNSLIQRWIGDDNMLFFWLFLKEYNIKLYKEIEKKVAINQKGDFMFFLLFQLYDIYSIVEWPPIVC
jgi:hypothetical protein